MKSQAEGRVISFHLYANYMQKENNIIIIYLYLIIYHKSNWLPKPKVAGSGPVYRSYLK